MNFSMDGNDAGRASDPLPHNGAELSGPEAISALVDGQLHGAAFAQAVEAVQTDAQLRARWQTYHTVGELLRQGQAADRIRASDDFAARVAMQLAAEPLPKPFGPTTAPAVEIVTVDAAAAALPDVSTASGAASAPAGVRRAAANDPIWRWRAVAGVATAVAFAAVGWNLLSGAVTTPVATSPVLARAEPVQQQQLQQQMIRDPRLDQLLAAHEQSGGISALQMPAGFLRNATFEGRGR